ncbi:hypothetical protein QJQ45_002435 [Haematococcus lacustris]|nr:hypothetical protein QJQ45_002435 [Haematococcus lacustris]
MTPSKLPINGHTTVRNAFDIARARCTHSSIRAGFEVQRIGESRWRPLELCWWPEQGKVPAKGKEYPGLRYKRVLDKPPKAQQQQQSAVAHEDDVDNDDDGEHDGEDVGEGEEDEEDVRITPAATLVKLFTADGQELQSFVQSDGSFEFEQVPPGSHLLQPFHISYFYPEVKVDVSPKAGLVRATQLGQPKPMPLPTPLQLRPLGELQYYEKRKPVDVWSIVKSPYGLMIVFSLFFIFVMPMLKVDPEEMKEAQAAMRGVLGGGSSATEQPAQQRIAGASR